MNKAELVDELVRRLGTDHQYAAAVVDTTVDTIMRTVHGGDHVTIAGFGVFDQRHRKARVMRSLRTAEIARSGAVAVPVFRPGPQFKAIVSGAQSLPRTAQAPRHDGGDGRRGKDASTAAGPTSSSAADGRSTSLEFVAVDAAHPEQTLVTEATEVKQTVSGPAVQKEARLMERFQQYLETHGRQVMRYRITPTGIPSLYSDLADTGISMMSSKSI